MTTYRIVRMFLKESKRSRKVDTGLTLSEAQAHCKDIQSSSSTCTNGVGNRRTKAHGAWFDGYEKEQAKRQHIR